MADIGRTARGISNFQQITKLNKYKIFSAHYPAELCMG
jgi:hypothetical protein